MPRLAMDWEAPADADSVIGAPPCGAAKFDSRLGWMPKRTFKIYDTGTLLVKYRELADAINDTTGPTSAARNSHTGFLLESGKVSTKELQVKLDLCRYEVWLRGQGVDGNPPQPTCADLEATNPLLEKVTRVQTMHSPGNGIIGGLAPGGWI